MSRIVEPQSTQPQSQTQAPTRSKLVQRLLDSGENLPQFLNDLLTTQAVVVAGTEAAAFIIERRGEEAGLRAVAHIRPDESDADTRANAIRAFQNIVGPCVEQGKDGAIEVGSPDGGDAQFCLVTLLRDEGIVVAVSAVITRARNVDRAKQRLTSMQLVAGYFELFSLRRNVEQARLMTQRHQHVLQYSGCVAMAEGFEASSMALCNELATRTGASRVALGWVKGKQIKVKALSHTEKFDKKQELTVQLQQVMEECLDQEEPVRFDPKGNSSANVTRSAAELSRKFGGNAVLSMPLRRREEVVGVLTLEFPATQPFDETLEAGVAVAVELLSPQLYDRYANDRFIAVKIGHTLVDWTKLALGPRHLGKVILGVLAAVAVVAILAWPVTYHVPASFTLVAQDPRVVCAPFDGTVREVLFRPGEFVQAGQVLAMMDTSEYLKSLEKAVKTASAERIAANSYRTERKISDAQQAESRAAAAEAEAALYRYYIDNAEIKAPITGRILRSELYERRGFPVKKEDPLFELAKTSENDPNSIAIEMEGLVADRDIKSVAQIFENRATLPREYDGTLAAATFPSEQFKFTITRIVPQGEAKDGKNYFKVRANVADPADWMKPGVAGEASIDIEKRSIGWIWTHRLVDWVQLKVWMWL